MSPILTGTNTKRQTLPATTVQLILRVFISKCINESIKNSGAILCHRDTKRNNTETLHSRILGKNSIKWTRLYHRDIHRVPYGDLRESKQT